MVLERLTRLWRSDDPNKRYIGLFGKLFVELGTCVLAAVVVYAPFALLDWQFDVFGLLSEPLAVLTTVAAISAYFGNLVFCKVITREPSKLDERLVELLGDEDEESGETPPGEEPER
ncbi:hypothetical protein [Haloparvum sedimenti]|uniref:hypothetical protein n=1 Tax=Haloparvum sedimenti TaxID=1678448 RepID=UPI00071E7D3A|nr:hypothetical protein [Haloparvum sedimenti]